mgnify:CR=1 FL=1
MVISMDVVVKKMDDKGRIVVPKKWRKKHPGKEYVLEIEEDEVKIYPLKKESLTKHIDSIEIDLESDLSDWHKIRKELKK